MISIWFTVTKIDQCRSIKLEKTIFTQEFGKAIHDVPSQKPPGNTGSTIANILQEVYLSSKESKGNSQRINQMKLSQRSKLQLGLSPILQVANPSNKGLKYNSCGRTEINLWACTRYRGDLRFPTQSWGTLNEKVNQKRCAFQESGEKKENFCVPTRDVGRLCVLFSYLSSNLPPEETITLDSVYTKFCLLLATMGY